MRLGPCLLIGSRKLQGASAKLADFCSAPMAGFYAAVDIFNSDEVFGDGIIDFEGSTSVFSEVSMDFCLFWLSQDAAIEPLLLSFL